ncbi:MAG: polyphenol oxidase family protein [Verrucomicrobiae bacterium]|nr:polyphenol oxidase family protein [Verrucomicrobiae bacterium]
MQPAPPPFETFAPLRSLPFLFHAFTLRTDADTRAPNYERAMVRAFGHRKFARAEQPHSNGVAHVNAPGTYPGVDALVTTVRGLVLLIRCADCAPIFLVAPLAHAIALVHCGRKGIQANVVHAAVSVMPAPPDSLLAVIGPCIGPCHYEVDLWTGIETQLRAAGVRNIHNERRCTACRPDRYYSYRAERGQTGRMFALLALRQPKRDNRRVAALSSQP